MRLYDNEKTEETQTDDAGNAGNDGNAIWHEGHQAAK